MIFYSFLGLFLLGIKRRLITDDFIRNDDVSLKAMDGGDMLDRRSMISSAVTTLTTAAASVGTETKNSKDDEYWPLWPALPIFPFSQRKTLVKQVTEGVWTFDQLIGIYYVHVPIRMTVVAMKESRGLLVYAPVAATQDCLNQLQPLIDQYGPIRYIILPSVAVEHKVLAGPFARKFPDAEFYVTDKQYSFPIGLPDRTLGFPSWTKPLPASSSGQNLWGGEFDHEVLTVKPGIGSMYQDVAFFHRPSKTLIVCDALLATTEEPPPLLTQEPEYIKALLFHARDYPTEIVADTPEARRKGWRRIVLLFNFFIPLNSADVDLGIKPLLALDPSYEYGWGGWMPFSWNQKAELESFQAYSANGAPTVYTIVQIILSRGNSGEATLEWVDKVKQWPFKRVIPAHLDAPLNIGPKEFSTTYDFIRNGKNQVRYCNNDVKVLQKAEEGPLNFSVYPSKLGLLQGQQCVGKNRT
mmetsp:Transcript_11781/g.29853  ORF Transcript_11781/g.29853 Transcript_11781/m.29853 type:complete len:468 (-) Transcript_11781:93-1496(-)